MSLEFDDRNADHLKVRFVLPLDRPRGTVSVVGSFNDWTAGLDELQDDGSGRRSVQIGVPYGTELVFRYLGEGGEWFDDPDADSQSPRGSVIKARTHRA